jgi:hypothetical protein
MTTSICGDTTLGNTCNMSNEGEDGTAKGLGEDDDGGKKGMPIAQEQDIYV